MPGTKKAMHPSGKIGIRFTEADHRYVDDLDIEYTSVTKLVHGAFAPFDGPAAAAAKSAKTGVPAEQYLREWEEAGKRASESGTRAHENCERQILGQFDQMNVPVDEEEKIRFRAAWHEVEELQSIYSAIYPETLVFSPRFRVAGSIDLLCKKDDYHYAIGDWKYIKGLDMEGYHGKKGTHPATYWIYDCNFYHYSLQLNLYKMILKLEGYIPIDATVDLFLKRYNKDLQQFDTVELPDLSMSAIILLSYNNTVDGLEGVPF